MKRFFIILSVLLMHTGMAWAQDTTRVAPVDSTLVGKDILTLLGPGVSVDQTTPVHQALQNYVLDNAEKPISGYRIRVFYDNGP